MKWYMHPRAFEILLQSCFILLWFMLKKCFLFHTFYWILLCGKLTNATYGIFLCFVSVFIMLLGKRPSLRRKEVCLRLMNKCYFMVPAVNLWKQFVFITLIGELMVYMVLSLEKVIIRIPGPVWVSGTNISLEIIDYFIVQGFDHH